MIETKEAIKIPIIKIFEGDIFKFDLKDDEDVILNSIKVYAIYGSAIYGSCMGEPVTFDIQKLSKEEIRVIPHSAHNKFMIKYYRLVNATTYTIKAKDIPRYKNMDGSISISFDKNGTVIN